jgi:Ca2+/Na+ antiporter
VSTLRYALAAGVFVYGAITLVQLVQNEAVHLQAIAVLAVLCVAMLVSWGNDEHRMRRYEMILLWVCVLAFSAYTLLRIGGFV